MLFTVCRAFCRIPFAFVIRQDIDVGLRSLDPLDLTTTVRPNSKWRLTTVVSLQERFDF
jgi:hypothetical protein